MSWLVISQSVRSSSVRACSYVAVRTTPLPCSNEWFTSNRGSSAASIVGGAAMQTYPDPSLTQVGGAPR